MLTGFIAPRFELRSLFLAGAGLIVFTGLVFPAAETFAFVLLIAFIGSINPSGGDSGMLVPLEHALLTRETAARERTAIFARYSLIGALTAAVGSLAAALPEHLASLNWSRLSAIKLMFSLYAALGLLAALLYRRLPRDHSHIARRAEERARAIERHRLQAGGAVQHGRLCRRFCRAVAAGAVAVPALRPVAGRPPASSSSGSSLLGAFSFPVAAWLAGRIGLINTMVFTHIPSSLCLIAAAFSLRPRPWC